MKIGIVGAGITGAMTALYLSRAGHTVQLFEQGARHQSSAATYTAAGMLAPFAELESGQHELFDMGVNALGLWAELSRSMSDDIGYVANGTIMLAHPQDTLELFRLHDILTRAGLAETEQCLPVTTQTIARMEPELVERFESGIYFPTEAQVDVPKVMRAIFAELERNSVAISFSSPVLQISPETIRLESKTLSFDWVVDCRGLQARADLPALRGVRGELVVLHAPDVAINRLIRLLHPRYRLYIAPQGESRYIVGASQLESDDRRPISVRSTLELLSAAVSVHAGFSEASIVETRAHCRPTLPDNEPRIFHEPGLLRVNGLYRHGFLLSPLLAREVSRVIGQDGQDDGYHSSLMTSVKGEMNEAVC